MLEARPTRSPARVVLPGVQKIGYIQLKDGSWELTPFASSLRSVLAYLGESITYDEVMAFSGAAFRMVWNPAHWDPGNSDISFMAADPLEPFRRAFAAAGYEAQFYGRQENRGASYFSFFPDYLIEEQMRSAIVASIDRQVPVIAFGVIGPPECCVVAGYDEGGGVLIGWNFFQGDPAWEAVIEKEESGYFRRRGWYASTEGLILIGAKRSALSREDLDRQVLEWALQVARSERANQHNLGQAAYNSWAEQMQTEAFFPAGDDETLSYRMTVIDDASMMIDARLQAARFLRGAALREPALAGNLLSAAGLYEREQKLAGELWYLPGKYEPRHRGLADPAVRRQIAEIILQARDLDAQAAFYLEQALGR